MDDNETEKKSPKKQKKSGKIKTIGVAALIIAGAYFADKYDVVNYIGDLTTRAYNKAETETVDFFTQDPGEMAQKFNKKTLEWTVEGKDLSDFTKDFEDAAYVGLNNIPYSSRIGVVGNVVKDLDTNERSDFLEYVVSNALNDTINRDSFIENINDELNKIGYEVKEKEEEKKLQEYWDDTKDFIKESSKKLKQKILGEPITSADTLKEILSDYIAEKFLELDDSTRYEVLEKYVTEGLGMRGVNDPMIKEMYINMNTEALFKKDKEGLKPFIGRYIESITEDHKWAD